MQQSTLQVPRWLVKAERNSAILHHVTGSNLHAIADPNHASFNCRPDCDTALSLPLTSSCRLRGWNVYLCTYLLVFKRVP